MALVVGILGHPDTADAQNSLVYSPTQLTFTAQLGQGTLPTQAVSLTTTGASLNYSVGATSPQGWLTVTSNTASTPGQILVFANATNLGTGSYSGVVTMTAAGAGNSPASIPVTLNVVSASSLIASPSSLSFTAQLGAAAPAAQTLSISSGTTGVPFSISSSVQTSAMWLKVPNSSGVTPGTVQVSVDATGLTAGSYAGTITLSSTQTGTVTVPVNLTVTAQPTLTVSQTTVAFYYQIGQASPGQTQLSISTGASTQLPFTVATNTTSCGQWLVVSPQNGTTPAQLSLQANIAGITQPSVCNGTVTITAPGALNSPQTVNVTLTASQNPLLIVSPLSAAFTYQLGGSAPLAQTISLSSTSTNFGYTASTSASWLLLTPLSGTTPQPLTLSVNPTGLNPGTYNATVTVASGGAANSPQVIPVTLTVSSTALLSVSPSFANFNYQIGLSQLPPSQSIAVTSTGAALAFAVAVPTTTGVQFVNVSPANATTPASLTLSLNQSVLSGLSAGTYHNTVVLTPTTGQNASSQSIPVTLTVSNSPLAYISPSSLNFSYAASGAFPTPQTLSITSTDGVTPLAFSVSPPNVSWLTVSSPPPTTPAVLNVNIAPFGLTPGVYTTAITVIAGGQTQMIPVTLTVSSGIMLTVAPSSLTFSQATGGPAPAAQSVTIGASGGTLPFTTAASTVTGGSWLTATPSGTAPGTISVSVNGAGLAPGTYTGNVSVVSVTASNNPVNIPVTFTVSSAPSLVASPVGVTFTASAGGVSPASQAVNITSATSGSEVQFSAAASTATGGAWLAVTPTTGTTPATLTVSANSASLAIGTYNGTVTLTPTSGGTPLTVAVTLTVSAQVVPSVLQIRNAASGSAAGVSPGELVSIYGSNLGPSTPAYLTLTPDGKVSTTLAGVTVTFDGVAAPLTYVSATQINCVVPYEIGARPSTQVVVTYNSLTSPATTQTWAMTAPGIFTQDSSGSGLGAILNQDNSLNGSSNRAAKGSVIQIFATGEGQTNPAGVTGAVTGSNPSKPIANITVTIGGVPAQVTYAGGAPTLVAGVLQIDAVIPNSVPSGNVTVAFTAGTLTSQSNLTVAVQ